MNSSSFSDAPLASSTDIDHWSQNSLLYGDGKALMQPTFFFNQRKTATELDFAALRDVGYDISNVPEPTVSCLLLFALAAITARRFRRGRMRKTLTTLEPLP